MAIAVYPAIMGQYDFSTAPADTRIVVGMSGGVDSAVAAALLVRAGYDVVGVTLELYHSKSAPSRAGSCCAGRDAADAARVAGHLNIPHYVLQYQDRFKRGVIDPFVESYANGATPVPCVLCNQTVKFTDLLETSRELGASALATGHYARRLIGVDGPELHRAVDLARDQSYFLFKTTPEQLDYLRFPLGAMTKDATRDVARALGLPVADKPDSQDICFVPSGHYSDVVKRLRPDTDQPGSIVDMAGNELGRHAGIIHFTVGQRRGLGLGGNDEPWYVVRLEPLTRRVIVGPRDALATTTVKLRDMSFLDRRAAQAADRPVTVKLRSAQAPIEASFSVADGSARLELAAPSRRGAAPGQAAVIYDGERVIAGGWIEHAADASTDAAGARLDSGPPITDNAALSRAAG